MLAVSNLECIRGGRRLFAGAGFRLGASELLYLQGPNGAGKTSLLRMLCGLLPPETGEIRWRGQPIARLGEAYRRELCFLGHHDAIKEELTPFENLMLSARLAGAPLGEDQALGALARLGLAGREDLACRYLSRGQKRRAALSRLAVDRRPLWLLDEPFAALDAAAVDEVAALIGAHLSGGGLAVLTTHQPVEIAAGAVWRLTLADGARPCCG
ncbi:MAG: cytochrome c biogenesis heme-transporting ATPase CcmA [Candidatus Accumulibacter sp.]|jgi:heme exporter protein A|nr:cytochrome c biogenesis heme-transporting ATPase CcmA [Accumulibacter sp.]